MRVLELFGGYGSQALALENLGIEFKSDLCEIDKYAIQAYNQIHGETFNYGDICSIDETKLPYYDLITYSSPCQDFSQAGKQAGGEKGSGTRSSLLWECERIIRAVKPKYLLMENVKALTSKKFMPLFANWLRTLEELGYKNWWKVLNAKDYGVPQNRERVFVVSILGGGQYQFPDPIPLTKRLKDVLEPQVDEKYYLSDKVLQNFKTTTFEKSGAILSKYATHLDKLTDVSGTLMARDYKGFGNQATTGVVEPVACASRGRNPDNPSDRTTGSPTEQRIEINTNGTTNTITTVQKDNYVIEPKVMQEPTNLYPNSGNPQAGRIYNTQGISPAMDTCQGGNRMPKVMVEGYFTYPNSDKKHQSNTVISKDGISTTLDTMGGGNLQPKITEVIGSTQKNAFHGDGSISPSLTSAMGMGGGQIPMCKYENYRIRKLTPRECWRLMGVKDEQFDKLHDISNCQLYKLAGNSIVVDVLMEIFKNMFEPTEQKGQLELL